MFDVLEEVERAIPRLLWQEGWNSLDVDYHDPRVERVWRQWLDYRVSLHVIHPCQPSASLFHPHPWPSAMRVLHGQYEMEIGYGTGLDHPPVACKMQYDCRYASGDRFVYEMTDPNGWHSVRPIDSKCLTVMVSGRHWERETEPVGKQLKPLTPQRMQQIIEEFRYYYRLPDNDDGR